MGKKLRNISKQVLNINDSPLKYIMRFYVPTMIAFQKEEEALPWFSSVYIQTKTRKNNKDRWMVYQNTNPFVTRLPLCFFSLIKKNAEFLFSVIKYLLLKEWYIFLNVDFFYLTEIKKDDKSHFNHSILVYGFDEEKQQMYLTGYCLGNKIETIEVSYEKFWQALSKCKKNDVWIYKRRKNVRAQFDYQFFCQGVEDYVKSKSSLKYQIKARSLSLPHIDCYGLKAHESLKKDLNDILNGDKKNVRVRIYAYFELASNMVLRLNYIKKEYHLNALEDIIKGFEFLAQSYKKVLMLYLKYEKTNNNDIILSLLDKEHESYELERQLFLSLLKEIDKKR